MRGDQAMLNRIQELPERFEVRADSGGHEHRQLLPAAVCLLLHGLELTLLAVARTSGGQTVAPEGRLHLNHLAAQ